MPATGGTPATGGAIGTGGTDNPAPTARDAAAAMGRGVNLGQMFESTQQPRTLAAASAKIDAYYAKGFRSVRIPITWTEPVGGDRLVNDANVGDVNRGHARLAVIEQVVDFALAKPDLYVIVNAHHESTLKTQSRSSVLERLWQDIAEIFADRDHRLIFELLNEPHRSDADNSPMPAADLREMSALAYAKIRAVDPHRILAIGGNQWFGAGEMAQVWPSLEGVGDGQDAYLMATFHHYDPWTFCGDNQGSYDDAWTDDNLSGPIDAMLDWASSVGGGMPVFIGEWGVGWGSRYDLMQCNNIRQWYQKLDHEFAVPRGVPTVVWDDGGWFKIFDHGSNGFDNNLVDCIGGDCAWDGADRFNDGCR
ncbi:MAG: glycoside hydrolase family 5 protein [Polyangiaceae bacterium]|nr:glycoside hydrolase family 5 protein [Polyangiaceae bacterium]